MTFNRRSLLAATAGAVLMPWAARAQGTDPRLAERSVGRPDAPVTVIEYFSLTCSHCASFHRETYPQVKRELIDTGKVRLVWRDFPLDQLALAAAVVARALPPERYEGFISALFASQDRWAFQRGGNPLDALFQVAALAGMTRQQFDAALADEQLRRGVLEMRLKGEQQHNINSTPSFIFGSRTVPGAISFERFAQLAAEQGAT